MQKGMVLVMVGSSSPLSHFPRRFQAQRAVHRSSAHVFCLARVLACGAGALLLIVFSAGMLWFLSAPAVTALARDARQSSLSSIRLNELLTNPKKDWDNDGDSGAPNQWIELENSSNTTLALSHLELLSQGSNNNQPTL